MDSKIVRAFLLAGTLVTFQAHGVGGFAQKLTNFLFEDTVVSKPTAEQSAFDSISKTGKHIDALSTARGAVSVGLGIDSVPQSNEVACIPAFAAKIDEESYNKISRKVVENESNLREQKSLLESMSERAKPDLQNYLGVKYQQMFEKANIDPREVYTLLGVGEDGYDMPWWILRNRAQNGANGSNALFARAAEKVFANAYEKQMFDAWLLDYADSLELSQQDVQRAQELTQEIDNQITMTNATNEILRVISRG